MFTPEQIAALQAPLNKANVKKNPKGFDYIEGWQAIAEANRIFGFDGWTREITTLALVAEPYKIGDNWRVGYRATVRITVGDVIRDGTGYGSGILRDLNDAHEGAVKEAETDAMKRALMTFGNPFGLALYDKTKANVVADAPAPAQTAPTNIAKGAEVPKVPTLTERADRLESTLKTVSSADQLRKAYGLASGLCADLDAKDPERLAELEVLYARLLQTFEPVAA